MDTNPFKQERKKSKEQLIQEEQEEVDHIVTVLDEETLACQKNLSREELEHDKAASSCLPDTYADLMHLNYSMNLGKDELKNLAHVRNELYGTRLIVDVSGDTGDARLDMKIGLHTFMDEKKDILVYSWVEPACRYFMLKKYAVHYRGKVNNEVTEYKALMRREVSANHNKVEDVVVTYPLLKEEEKQVINERLLHDLLKRRQDQEFHNIVFSIQQEQANILMRPGDENLIVQGCAGSGKSMIMMHRLPLLLYDEGGRLDNRHIYVITPSETYIDMAWDMRNELEIEDLKMGTMQEYYNTVLARYGIFKGAYGRRSKVALTNEQERKAYSAGLREHIENNIQKTVYRYEAEVMEACKEHGIKLQLHQQTPAVDVRNIVIALNSIKVKERPQEDPRWKIDSLFQLRQVAHAVSLAKSKMPESADRAEEKEAFTQWLEASPEILGKDLTDIDTYSESFIYNQILETQSWLIAGRALPPEKGQYAGIQRFLLTRMNVMDKLLDEQRSSRPQLLEFYTIKDYYAHLSKRLIYDIYIDAMQKIGWRVRRRGTAVSTTAASCSPYLYTLITYLVQGVTPAAKENLIMIDEAQNLAPEELRLLEEVNANTCVFNLFGDVHQHIEGSKGVDQWNDLKAVSPFVQYDLNENFRNAEPITEYCKNKFHMNMQSVSVPGEEVHDDHASREEAESTIDQILQDDLKEGISAIIVRDDAEAAWFSHTFWRNKGVLNNMSEKEAKLRNDCWNVFTVKQAKGLEFNTVITLETHMTEHEKYISCTRALDELYVFDFEFAVDEEKIDDAMYEATE